MMVSMNLLSFTPIYQDRVWGGQNLAKRLGRALPHTGPIGEAWEIVDRNEAQSIHDQSKLSLRSLLTDHRGALMGPGFTGERFPILVKWLDCQDCLSVQVHPPASVADQLGGEPKTECWFIADAEPKAGLYVGLKHGTDEAGFRETLAGGQGSSLTPLLHRLPTQAGEAILLKSGRLHAIDAGNLILEIQQNSDTTYRVHDWDRLGLDGQPRDLHIDASLASIDFDDIEPALEPAFNEIGERVVAECDVFRIRQVNLAAGDTLTMAPHQQPAIVSVVSGRVHADPNTTAPPPGLAAALEPRPVELAASTNVVCPYVWGGTLTALAPTTVLVTDGFV